MNSNPVAVVLIALLTFALPGALADNAQEVSTSDVPSAQPTSQTSQLPAGKFLDADGSTSATCSYDEEDNYVYFETSASATASTTQLFRGGYQMIAESSIENEKGPTDQDSDTGVFDPGLVDGVFSNIYHDYDPDRVGYEVGRASFEVSVWGTSLDPSNLMAADSDAAGFGFYYYCNSDGTLNDVPIEPPTLGLDKVLEVLSDLNRFCEEEVQCRLAVHPKEPRLEVD